RMDEKGVSPVIGVILMVAITVILAAVIASFVFGMGSSVKKTYNVAVTAQQLGDNVTVTLVGGPDVQSLQSISVNCTASDGTTDSGTLDTTVGSTITLNCGTGGADRVLVVGKFKDGTEQVLLDTTV
ncbi:MAG: type IV pilin N-terminal domain-containing protein, partial [Archaeoglobus sp.]|uniref:type IV pilin N-terminal domain-containing protein n=1 Tax=Archaeoglobus sp. TaxID=1872626 RepID=UPI001DA9FDE6